MVREYFKITKISLSSIMRVSLKRKFELVTEDRRQKLFQNLLIKTQLLRAVLSKELKILDTLNRGHVSEFLLAKNIILFFCNK